MAKEEIKEPVQAKAEKTEKVAKAPSVRASIGQKFVKASLKGVGIFTPLLTVETAVDMKIGDLYGLNADGKAVKADAPTGIYAIGIVDKTSTEMFGEAFKLEGNNILRAGSFIDVWTDAVLQVEEAKAQAVGDPVYTGADGEVTFTKPASNVQPIGYVGNATHGWVKLTIGAKGE